MKEKGLECLHTQASDNMYQISRKSHQVFVLIVQGIPFLWSNKTLFTKQACDSPAIGG